MLFGVSNLGDVPSPSGSPGFGISVESEGGEEGFSKMMTVSKA